MSLSETVGKQVVDAAYAAARAAGVDVYDLEIPKYPGGILRIDLWRANEALDEHGKRHGVLLDECAKVSKAFEEAIQGLGIFEDDYTLEVSSPGITRTLRTMEHFTSAVGERAEVVLNQFVIDGAGQENKSLGKRLVGKIIAIQPAAEGEVEILLELSNKKKAKQKRSPSAAQPKKDAAGVSQSGVQQSGIVSVLFPNVKEASIYFDFNEL